MVGDLADSGWFVQVLMECAAFHAKEAQRMQGKKG